MESLESVGMEIGEDWSAQSDDSITQTQVFSASPMTRQCFGESSISSVTTSPHRHLPATHPDSTHPDVPERALLPPSLQPTLDIQPRL